MKPYPFDSISLNGRVVTIDAIQSGHSQPLTDFEAATMEFIDQWLAGKNAFIQKTSGSTGVPKQIEINRAHMVSSALATAEALGLAEGTTALICLDTQYIAGKMMVVR